MYVRKPTDTATATVQRLHSMTMTDTQWQNIDKAQLRDDYGKKIVSIALPQPPTQLIESAPHIYDPTSLTSATPNSSTNDISLGQEKVQEPQSPLPSKKRQRISTENTIKINSIEKSIKVHNDSVTSLKYFKRSGNNYLVSGSYDKKVIITDLRDENNSKIVLPSSKGVLDVLAFEMNSKHYIAVCGWKKGIDIWSLQTNEVEYTLKGHSYNINRLILYENSNSQLFLISSSDDETIKIWNLASKSCVASLKGHSSVVEALALYRKDNQSFLASGSGHGDIKLWDLTSNTCMSTLLGYSGFVRSITVFYKDGIPFLVSGSEDKTIKVWDLSNNKLEITLKDHSNQVTSLKILMIGDKLYLASGGWDKTIIIWDLSNFTKVKELEAPSNVTSLETFDDDKKNTSYLASGHFDGTIKFWPY